MMTTEEKNGAVELAMTELEERLRGTQGKELAATVLENFDKLIRVLEDSKKAGLTPDKFAATETLLKSVAAASETVVAFTQFHHPCDR